MGILKESFNTETILEDVINEYSTKLFNPYEYVLRGYLEEEYKQLIEQGISPEYAKFILEKVAEGIIYGMETIHELLETETNDDCVQKKKDEYVKQHCNSISDPKKKATCIAQAETLAKAACSQPSELQKFVADHPVASAAALGAGVIGAGVGLYALGKKIYQKIKKR